MNLLARRINPAKWKAAEWATNERIPGDVVSIDMRTESNTLSFWRCKQSIDGLEPEDTAVLALLGTLSKLDKIDVVFVEEDKFPGEWIVSSDGGSSVTTLNGLHIDLVEIDYDRLGMTARVLGAKIFADEFLSLTRTQVKVRLNSAIAKGILNPRDLSERLRADLA